MLDIAICTAINYYSSHNHINYHDNAHLVLIVRYWESTTM